LIYNNSLTRKLRQNYAKTYAKLTQKLTRIIMLKLHDLYYILYIVSKLHDSLENI